jgi:hypothetical protein
MYRIADSNSFVFVELTTDGVTKTLALPPREERALTVGSADGADFLVDRARAAPVQFHLDRCNEAVWLVPAYGVGDLRVNAALASGPIPLEARNVVEFRGIQLELRVLGSDDFADDSDELATGQLDAGKLRQSYSLNLPSDDDTTLFAMRAVSVTDQPRDEYPTQVVERVPVGAWGLQSQRTERIAPYRPPVSPIEGAPPFDEPTTQRMAPLRNLVDEDQRAPAMTATGTEIMAPFRPGRAQPATEWARQTRHLGTPGMASVETVPIAQKPRPVVPPELPRNERPAQFDVTRSSAVMAPHAGPTASSERTAYNPASHVVEVTRREIPAHAALSKPLSNSEPPVVLANSAAESRRPEGDFGASARTVRPSAEPVSWLARLGMLTRARPLIVAVSATLGSLLLAALLLTATRIAQRHRSVPHPTGTDGVAPISSSLVPVATSQVTPVPSSLVQVVVTPAVVTSTTPPLQSVPVVGGKRPPVGGPHARAKSAPPSDSQTCTTEFLRFAHAK